MSSKWITISRIKKSKKILVKGRNNHIDLRGYTKGVGWNNSKNIYGLTMINPKKNVLTASMIVTKEDENNYNVTIQSYKYVEKETKNIATIDFYNKSIEYDIVDTKHFVFILRIKGSGRIIKPREMDGIVNIKINNKKIGQIIIALKWFGGKVTCDSEYGQQIIKGESFVTMGTPPINEYNVDSLFYFSYSDEKDIHLSIETGIMSSIGSFDFCTLSLERVNYTEKLSVPSIDETGALIFYEQGGE